MKQLKEYLELPYRIELLPDEGGYLAAIPDLPGCMASGDDPDEAIRGLQEAKELWIEGRLQAGLPVPEPSDAHEYSGKLLLRIPKSLHWSLDQAARRESTSLNQYLVHLLSRAHEQERLIKTVQQTIESALTEPPRGWPSLMEGPPKAHDFHERWRQVLRLRLRSPQPEEPDIAEFWGKRPEKDRGSKLREVLLSSIYEAAKLNVGLVDAVHRESEKTPSSKLLDVSLLPKPPLGKQILKVKK